jgi:hypothetical protein
LNISKDERRLENIAKQQRNTIFNKWIKEKLNQSSNFKT